MLMSLRLVAVVIMVSSTLARPALAADPNKADESGKTGSDYMRLIQANPKSAAALCDYAVYLEDVQNDLASAEKFHQMAVGQDPKYVRSIYKLARFQLELHKNVDGAERMYRQALEIDPQHVIANYNLGVLLEVQRGDMEAAKQQYMRTLDLAPAFDRALGNLVGLCTNRLKDNDTAERYLRAAIEHAPSNPRPKVHLAWFLHHFRGDKSEPERLFKSALDQSRGRSWVSTQHAAFLLWAKKDQAGAEEIYKKVLESEKNDFDAVVGLGDIAFERSQCDAAEARYREAMKLDPKAHSPYFKLGLAFERRGNLVEAQKQLAKAVDLFPEYAEAKSGLWTRAGQPGRAGQGRALPPQGLQVPSLRWTDTDAAGHAAGQERP